MKFMKKDRRQKRQTQDRVYTLLTTVRHFLDRDAYSVDGNKDILMTLKCHNMSQFHGIKVVL